MRRFHAAARPSSRGTYPPEPDSAALLDLLLRRFEHDDFAPLAGSSNPLMFDLPWKFRVATNSEHSPQHRNSTD
ncbi:MAG: hypothetical protein ACYTGL_14435 [Planctomycetota bacterium]|jgi:hypothetical protein